MLPGISSRGDLRGAQMVVEDIGQLGNWLSAEAAIGAEPKIGQIFSRGRQPLLKARHVVNGTQIDAGALRLELPQRREEHVVTTVEHRNMDPIHGPA